MTRLTGLLLATAVFPFLASCTSNSPASPSLPNAQGFWHGGWTGQSCSSTGSVAKINCDHAQLGDFNLRLTQAGQLLDGLFIYVCQNELGGLTGTVEADGTVTLSGSGVLPPYRPMAISAFRASISGDAMTGSLTCTVDLGNSNTYTVNAMLQGVKRFSPDPNAPF